MTGTNDRAGRDRWPGFFLAIDGPGGVGKSTVTNLVTTRLAYSGRQVYATTEPSRGPIGELARHGTYQLHGAALACLVAADRYHHLATEICPALNAGHIVVCDRYVASSLVLQRHDGLPVQFIESINWYAPPPDLTVILTAHPATIRGRLAERGKSHGRFEDTEATDTELAFYADAARLLSHRGIKVIVLNCTNRRPDQIADEIAGSVMHRWNSVTRSATDYD